MPMNNQDAVKPMTIADAMREGDAKRANNQDAVKLLPYPVTPEVWQLACEYYARGQGNEQTRIIGEFIMLVQYLRNNAPTPREQELEAQNKALWELVGDLIGYADAMYDGTGPWPHDKKQLENKLAAIQKAKEAK
jgi:hypothetical protein